MLDGFGIPGVAQWFLKLRRRTMDLSSSRKARRFPRLSQHRMKSTAWRFWGTLTWLSLLFQIISEENRNQEVSARSNSAFGRWPNEDGNRRLTSASQPGC